MPADKLALIFSSDWFRPHWRAAGFVPRPGSDETFQGKMRTLVRRLIQDADCYWHVSFAEARVGETRTAFLDIVEQSASRESKLGLIRAVVDGRALEDGVLEVSQVFWDDYEATVAAVEDANITSSDWDRYLVSLTPDLPSLLKDFALIHILRTC